MTWEERRIRELQTRVGERDQHIGRLEKLLELAEAREKAAANALADALETIQQLRSEAA